MDFCDHFKFTGGEDGVASLYIAQPFAGVVLMCGALLLFFSLEVQRSLILALYRFACCSCNELFFLVARIVRLDNLRAALGEYLEPFGSLSQHLDSSMLLSIA